MERFRDKVVLITGATSGIGAATAKMFAREGAKVIAVGRNRERGAKLEDTVLEGTGSIRFVECDVTRADQIEALFLMINDEYKALDCLFSNAGVFITSRLENLIKEEWDLSFATNVTSAMEITKQFKPLLVKSKGNIVFNASISGLQSFTSGTANYMYGSSKAALVKFSNICALNFASEGVRVNCICPGIIDTEIYTNRDFSRFDGMIPMGRVASPEEVARVVLFLASEDASYITGAVLPIDGGASLK